MPATYYTQDEWDCIKRENEGLRQQVDCLEALRPAWAMGYSSDSIAAQCSSAALSAIWNALGVSNQTDAMSKLRNHSFAR